MLRKCAAETDAIVTVEEHLYQRRLGGAIAKICWSVDSSGKFKRRSLPTSLPFSATRTKVYKYYGMDPEGIANTITGC